MSNVNGDPDKLPDKGGDFESEKNIVAAFFMVVSVFVFLFIHKAYFSKSKQPIDGFMGVQLQEPIDIISYAREKGFKLVREFKGEGYYKLHIREDLPNAELYIHLDSDKAVVEKVILSIEFEDGVACEKLTDGLMADVSNKYSRALHIWGLADVWEDRGRSIGVRDCTYYNHNSVIHTNISFTSEKESLKVRNKHRKGKELEGAVELLNGPLKNIIK